MYLGIDCGTQGTKVIVVDSQQKCVIGEGYAPHQIIENGNGRREQQPNWWIEALLQAFKLAIHSANISPKLIKGMGVSGQQHGLVVLDKNDTPLYNAKLWCDTETATENDELIQALGGSKRAFEQLGILCQTGYTASKISWLRKYHPQLYTQIAKIMLPHDYLNYWLTGIFATEYGDASGTGYFDVINRQWDYDTFNIIAPELDPKQVLPQLIPSHKKLGMVRKEIAQLLGLSEQVVVSTGGGDNMMGAIGTGNIKQGIVTMSLGTSGTLYAYTDKPLTTLPPMIANFCSSSDGWLPLVCVMNMTSVNNTIMSLFDLDVQAFNDLVTQSEVGAGGITMLPFFNGERVPALPNAKGTILGLDSTNCTQSNLARATMESASFTLCYGLNLFRQAGLDTSEIRLIGGGAKSTVWRQMIADIMNVNVVCLKESEAAALGSVIQVMWINNEGDLTSLCDNLVHIDESSTVYPKRENVKKYNLIYQRYLNALNQQYF
ncbi:xylulokinase [Pasteurella skyensis]|uniref:Xylulose kinase n=1 Tax=Phocoenobacter skyensis TaxID=97481 RepID=A0AAJ6NAF0_9PAST|nr:xylulokinase [Pasteurella skyensis]MDP8162726.1 xylulokinase [Pasteurella skyensis]MDP8173197.1 xylulokinase [Pasteurella skyensis]MDP8177586.1 xylulokinase [Pasteurella skyensis]MDP8178828.1 xylulokinase [Pasteurella skyensis]MDP8183128.1 xylulokinase [Pasteurella skyensis]